VLIGIGLSLGDRRPDATDIAALLRNRCWSPEVESNMAVAARHVTAAVGFQVLRSARTETCGWRFGPHTIADVALFHLPLAMQDAFFSTQLGK
jgi:hypothetical protein